ncbi:hypothetical protein OQA88_7900 [Cercophora sp. LCS_1]
MKFPAVGFLSLITLGACHDRNLNRPPPDHLHEPWGNQTVIVEGDYGWVSGPIQKSYIAELRRNMTNVRLVLATLEGPIEDIGLGSHVVVGSEWGGLQNALVQVRHARITLEKWEGKFNELLSDDGMGEGIEVE